MKKDVFNVTLKKTNHINGVVRFLPKIKKEIILASNCTIDPVEDLLKFRNDYFSSPFDFEFAPIINSFSNCQGISDKKGRTLFQ